MKKLTALSSLVVIAAFIFFTNTTQADFVAGKDYVVLDKAVKTDTADKIEVRELFWYYCGHCYNFEPYVENWLKTMDSRAEFIRQPCRYIVCIRRHLAGSRHACVDFNRYASTRSTRSAILVGSVYEHLGKKVPNVLVDPLTRCSSKIV